MTDHVFISHSEKDKTLADRLLNALESRGITCWIAPRDIPPGGSYADAILTAIEQCSCFVLVYTEQSNNSGHVLREVERAVKFEKNIVPVRFDQSAPSRSLDYLLATVHWLSVPTESVDAAAKQIAHCVRPAAKNSSPPSSPSVEHLTAGRVDPPMPIRPKPTALLLSLFILFFAAAAAIIALSFLKKPGPTPPAESIPNRSVAEASPLPSPPQLQSPSESAPSVKSPPISSRDDPEDTLRRYFACFGERDAQGAYNHLSAKFRAKLSFRKYSETFSSTSEIKLLEAKNISSSSNSATILVTFEETDAELRRVRWHGPFDLVREAAGWRIDTMQGLKRVSDGTSTQQAQSPSQSWDHPHIHLQLANDSQRKAALELKQRLVTFGYVVVAIETVSGNVDIPKQSSELRYFTPADSAEAQRIARQLESFFGNGGIVAYPPEGMPYVSHARQYEIWFSQAFRGAP
jgi:hypothetical protein